MISTENRFHVSDLLRHDGAGAARAAASQRRGRTASWRIDPLVCVAMERDTTAKTLAPGIAAAVGLPLEQVGVAPL